MDKDVLILAIESSCDETAAAVVKNGRDVLSNIIYSQIELHKLYGGRRTRNRIKKTYRKNQSGYHGGTG